MPDYNISLTAEEVIVWLSFYPTVEDGILEASRRKTKIMANQIVTESTSQKDPKKLSVGELRAEITALDGADEIPTYAERNPE